MLYIAVKNNSKCSSRVRNEKFFTGLPEYVISICRRGHLTLCQVNIIITVPKLFANFGSVIVLEDICTEIGI